MLKTRKKEIDEIGYKIGESGENGFDYQFIIKLYIMI